MSTAASNPSNNAEQRTVVLDTETTGLEHSLGHRIIEIGCIEMFGRTITKNTFHHFINPEREIDAGAQAVHGIALEDLVGKPKFADIADELIAFLTGANIVIHNAPFDVGFMNAEFKRLGKPPVHEFAQITDSLPMARAQFPGKKNSLDALCERLDVDNSGRTFHGALLDAQLLAEVYLGLTRGQESLSIDLESGSSALKKIETQSAPARIVRASEEEEAAHRAYLETMAKKANVIWQIA
jgi:DNA polymerase III subunit epsilon